MTLPGSQDGCLDEDTASLFEEALWLAMQTECATEGLLPVLIALRVQVMLTCTVFSILSI